MGVLKDAPGADKDAVWQNVRSSGDYPRNRNAPSQPSADYVFGRMMKLRVEYGPESITFPDHHPSRDYQAWAVDYPTYDALFDATLKSLGVTV